MPTFTPYLAYRDAPAAIEFLTKAFGFEERFRHPMPDGRIGHCELGFRGGAVFLASAYEEMGFRSPLELDGIHGQVYVEVEDVDAHFSRAREAGATIAAEPAEEHGTRMYRCVDPEGHRWLFAQPLDESSR